MRDLDALLAFVAGREAMPFAWGSNDCASYAGGAVAAQTGRNPLADLPGWATARGAARAAAQLGGVAAAVSARLEPIHPAQARRGDVAGVADDAIGVALMVVEGATLVGPGDLGNRRLPRAAAILAWSAEP